MLPLDELTACQQLVSAWINDHLPTLVVVGFLAVIGEVATLGFVMNILGALADRVITRWRTTTAQEED